MRLGLFERIHSFVFGDSSLDFRLPSMMSATPATKNERNPKNEKAMLGRVPTQNAQKIRKIPGRKYFQR